jgi:hypothetical protein
MVANLAGITMQSTVHDRAVLSILLSCETQQPSILAPLLPTSMYQRPAALAELIAR